MKSVDLKESVSTLCQGIGKVSLHSDGPNSYGPVVSKTKRTTSSIEF